jgi:hypothetical protein
LIIPADFAKQRDRRQTAPVQFLLDAVNSNSAGTAEGYAARIIAALNERLAQNSPAVSLQVEGGPASQRGQLVARIALLSMLSGATTPVEAMPEWMQPFTLLNPISHFSTMARGILLKGAGVEALWPHLFALVGFAVLLVGVSAWRFRKQLG